MGLRAELRECGKVMRLVWPLALGMANNAVMQFVDRAFLARESQWSLEAVLPAGVLATLFIGFFGSLAAYSGTFVAQHHGAGDRRGSALSYYAGLLLALLSIGFLVALLPLGRIVFEAFGHSGEVVSREVAYYSIVMAGGFAQAGAMAANGYFTGIGRTRILFWVNLLGNGLNVVLDYWLIFGGGPVPALGIQGAALATVAAQLAQCMVLNALVFHAIGSAPAVRLRNNWSQLGRLVARVLRYGVPAALYQAANMLSFAIFVFVTGKLGDMELAVSNAAFTVNYLLIAPIAGFSIGASTLVGQCQGAGDAKGAMRGAMRTLVLAEIYVAVASAAVLLAHRPILALFAADQTTFEVASFVRLGLVLFVLMVAWQFFDAADVVLSGALKGAGDTRFVLWWMLVCAFVFWLPLVFATYQKHPTMPALWSTMVVYVAVICTGTALRWRFGPWRKIKLIENADSSKIAAA